MNMKPDQELRINQRVDFEASIDVQSEDTFFTGFTRNISNGGLFLVTGSAPPVGSKVVVRFQVPNMPEPIVAEAAVCWVRPYRIDTPDVQPGMGVEFRSLPDLAIKAIDAFILKNDTLFYE